MSTVRDWKKFLANDELANVFMQAKSVTLAKDFNELVALSLGNSSSDTFEVAYDIPGQGKVIEARVDFCRNGVAVNYPEPYMRRRDPDTMVIADEKATDKAHFNDRFNTPFSQFRQEVLDWLKKQDLLIVPFYSGNKTLNCPSLLIGPKNAAFFSASLASLQGMVNSADLPEIWAPKAVIFLAPTFRHTHCQGKQIVVHHRQLNKHEIFSLNLYPGPSAKKGIYGVLINLGENEGWITAHGSTVVVTTPYDNEFVIMHEGASGGGKSEMLQYPHREPDGRLLVGTNVITQQRRFIPLFQGCRLNPVTDDMALCHPSIQDGQGRLIVEDAEQGWFVRVNHITQYGTDSFLEEMTTAPKVPLIFLNLYSVPKATCLIWEHTQDKPGVACPNPRIILPRNIVPGIVKTPVEINIRSFGIRTPPCTAQKPTYGIIGMLHILPPALAWLWRLVSPRGYDNPSITQTEGMSSEGVGSYWPFATGRRVDQANLLLKQIVQTPRTKYSLTPNQYIGAWKVGFMPQWLVREYLARRGGAFFKPSQLEPARCPLLGYAVQSLQIEGVFVNKDLLQVETQPEIGTDGYDQGAQILTEFFKQELKPYLQDPDLDPLGKTIIESFMNHQTVEHYAKLIPQS
ncbi:MAG: DUF4914 family protein [Candidatus Omnitrophica bacterium]|nr:DUF4914 family protein [Candidatus Omnitrophota bacterium]